MEIKKLMEGILEAESKKEALKSGQLADKPDHLELNQRQFDKLVETIRVLMEKIDTSIMQFKQEEKERYEHLNVEEKLLSRDLVQFEEKLQAWERDDSATSNDEPKSILDNPKKMKQIEAMNRKKLHEESIPTQVVEFEQFLAENGGMNGGWDERDHAHFLRIRAKVKGNQEQLFAQASQQIPDKDYMAVKEHEEFYVRLLLLQDRKREAIKRWRETRQKEKIESFEVSEEKKILRMQQYEDRRRQLEQKQREDTKKKLEAWRETKEQEAQRLEEEERVKREEEQRRKEMEARKRKEEARVALEELRNQREEKQKVERQQTVKRIQQQQQSNPITPEELERMKQREEEYMQRMAYLKNRKAQEQMEREERIQKLKSQVRVEVERDFSRLLQPTTSQQNRVKELKKEGPDNASMQFNFDIRRVQHRIQPSWRTGT